ESKSDFNNISHYGLDSLCNQIEKSNADIVLNGIAGSSGLLPSISTLKSKKDLALANKESMVMAGKLINKLAIDNNVKILPVDSEHSAIFHLLENCRPEHLDEIILTASGGAFRDYTFEQLKTVTFKDALQHPTWSMGDKITIDSASMANKGLEVIEAAMLFNLPKEKIKVLIHPQSYVHSIIRKSDMSMYAQISSPDMCLPIQNALLYPELEKVNSTFLDLANKQLTFSKPDYSKYKMLELAYKALEKGEAYHIAYNATNEVLVDLFIKDKIQFLDIPMYTERVLDQKLINKLETIEDILGLDSYIRDITLKIVGN
ncbi:MAG: 1-deoxy-D-xylulose-5-phosphate reductoisomerase, partial [Spirochaetales bacterium]|nr:1-deoxy-D-xylulose-5-phosphate reductoisomerase [Spirochaetales bacterium]